MARASRGTQTDKTHATTSSGGSIARPLVIVAVFVLAAVAGVFLVRGTVGPSRSVVNVEELVRQDEVRTASLEVVSRAEQLIGDGKIDEAIRLLGQVTESDPNFYLGHLMLGYMYMHSGKLPLAAKATRRAHQLEPDDFAVSYQMGQIELTEGKTDSAVELIARAIEQRRKLDLPPAPEYHIAMADALSRGGNPVQADRQMEIALETDRQGAIEAVRMAGPAAQVSLGRALVRLRDVEEAARLFALACRQRPDRADWRYLTARAYHSQGKFVQAREFIQEAVDLDPTNATYVRLKQLIEGKQSGKPLSELITEESEPNVPSLFDW